MNKILKKIGFDEFEIEIYDYLLKNGTNKPSQISCVLDIKRPTVYKALYSLEEKNVVERVADNNSLSFRTKDPRFLNYLIQKERKKVNKLVDTFLQEYPTYQQIYSQVNATPIIDIFYGVKGLKKVHKEIEENAEKVMLLRSKSDRNTKNLQAEIDRHVEARSKKAVKIRIITPNVPTLSFTKKYYPKVEGRAIKYIDPSALNMDTQIMLYNNKVSITNYKGEIVTLLIQQADIFKSFKTLFDFLWSSNRFKNFP